MPWPDGHFYSAIPSVDDLNRSQEWRQAWVAEETAGLSISPDSMLNTGLLLANAVGDFRLAQIPTADRRYGLTNGQFNSGDAGLLTAFIAWLRPSRIIEIGGGYSTACMLDAIDAFSTGTDVTTIEPYPLRLHSLLAVEDTPNLTLIDAPVQDFPLSELDHLVAGDIVFIDSSHVAKAGSDVLFEMFEMIPRIPRGVFIHIHDILQGFEYPTKWQEEGRFWNESYLLRALLIGNSTLNVKMWPASLSPADRRDLLARMPILEGRIGGSFWMEVIAIGTTR
jgi:predicted O-methyltransferase YrrM